MPDRARQVKTKAINRRISAPISPDYFYQPVPFGDMMAVTGL
jgi:hypothetical protein